MRKRGGKRADRRLFRFRQGRPAYPRRVFLSLFDFAFPKKGESFAKAVRAYPPAQTKLLKWLVPPANTRGLDPADHPGRQILR